MIRTLCTRLLRRTGPYADLLLVASYTTVVASVLQSPEWMGPTARIPVALPVLLFAPGYALVAAIFPTLTVESVTSDDRAPPTRPRNRLNGLVPVERVTLAVVASASLLPMVLYGLSLVTRIRLSLICAVVAIVTGGCCAIAASRRPVTDWEPPEAGGLGREVLGIESLFDVLPVLAAVVAVVLVAAAGVVVLDGNGETANAELAIGTENAAGNVTIEDYQGVYFPDDTGNYTVQIEHHGDAPREYTYVVGFERQLENSSKSWSVRQRTSVTAQPSTPVTDGVSVQPGGPPGNGTIVVLLYEGQAPETPTRDNALRAVSIPVEVQSS
ncbi:DUF1616 domain-containing protein [Haloarcula sp. CBA1127]|uniref:DUF1616 domain-containing protein n=1 Tax=Haloarcula sp. CBA1127 TaxID=1765055 RepID=UPI0009AE5171|nr:DUF1616 domain-containing protein [Haloarcula sp. CBA1127]